MTADRIACGMAGRCVYRARVCLAVLTLLCLLPMVTRADVGAARGIYPLHTGSEYVTRYPDPKVDYLPVPTLEQLNKTRMYDLDPAAGIGVDGFTLWAIDDFGNHAPELQEFVRLSGKDMVNGDYHLVVHLREAPSLHDFFFYVRYHIEQYSPRYCHPGSVFGFEGDRLWMVKLNMPGIIAAGMTRIRPDVNGGTIVEDGVICEITFEKREMDVVEWWPARAPEGTHNQPAAVTAYISPDDNAVVIYWQERNAGDYNNDGEVTITDLIPVGRRYGRISTDAHEDEWDWRVDGNHDGEVNRRDTWLIDENMASLLQGYRVYRRPAGVPRHEEELLPHNTASLLPMSIHRPVGWDPVVVPEYRYYDRGIKRTERPREWTYRIVPYNAADNVEGDKSAYEFTVSVTRENVKIL